MSKILLIEPSRMLQHAFVLALFPEHDVEIAADIKPTSTARSAVDLAIIDAASLRQRNSDSALPGWPADWQVPIIWIDTNPSEESASSRTACLALPFTKEELRAAVGKLLQDAPAGSEKEGGRVRTPARSAERGQSSQAIAANGESDKKIIELVEVVEEADQHSDRSAGAHSRD